MKTYQEHWGFIRSPFPSRVDPADLFESPTHEEALARLHFLLSHGCRAGLLLGASGSGKSLVLSAFEQQLRNRGELVIRFSLLGLSHHEFLWNIAAKLGVDPQSRDSLLQLWRGVSDHLIEARYQHRHLVILLDDVEDAEAEVLTGIARILAIDASPESRTTIVLAADRQHFGRLGNRLLEQCELRVELDPWDDEDTANFVEASLRTVGAKKSVFSAEALAHLHQLSGGMPRRVGQLAQLALFAAAGQELEEVDSQTVHAVFEELAVSAAISS